MANVSVVGDMNSKSVGHIGQIVHDAIEIFYDKHRIYTYKYMSPTILDHLEQFHSYYSYNGPLLTEEYQRRYSQGLGHSE